MKWRDVLKVVSLPWAGSWGAGPRRLQVSWHLWGQGRRRRCRGQCSPRLVCGGGAPPAGGDGLVGLSRKVAKRARRRAARDAALATGAVGSVPRTLGSGGERPLPTVLTSSSATAAGGLPALIPGRN